MSITLLTRRVAIGVVFGGLAFTMGFLPLSFPFPLIPYLRFDLAEIPSFIATMLFGPSLGMLAAFSHFLALLFFGEWSPIGPALKFLAVASSIVGFWAASRLFAGRGLVLCSFGLGLSAAVVRIIVMTVTNYLILVIILPEALEFAVSALRASTGFAPTTLVEKLFLVLIFTALYNGLHIPLSMVPSYLIMKSIAPMSIRLGSGDPWIVRVAKIRQGRAAIT